MIHDIMMIPTIIPSFLQHDDDGFFDFSIMQLLLLNKLDV